MDDWSIADSIPDAAPGLRPLPTPNSVDGSAGSYRVVSRLGSGGAGDVFRAIDGIGRPVALKLLQRFDDPRRVERFLREGRTAAALRHPNIVAIHEAGLFEGRPFIAYELIEDAVHFGAALKQRTLSERLDLFLQVCDGVAFAHQRGVTHRDLKPENILMGDDDRPRVADFGLSLSESDQRLTLSGAMVGTPRYMSPEQARGETQAHGPASDVWSLGVILYEALTGELPFTGGNLAELVLQISHADPIPLRRHDPSIDPALERVVLRALSADPARRYDDAGELARALIQARATDGRRLPLLAGALALLGVAGLGAGLALHRAPQVEPAPTPSATARRRPLAPALAEVRQMMRSKRLVKALELTDALVLEHPDEVEAWLVRGDVFVRRERWREALVCYQRATKLGPTKPEGYIGRGLCKAHLGEAIDGLPDLDRAVGLDPDHADALEKRSLLHYRRRSYDAALKDAERAVRLAPASAEARNARGLARAARGDLKGGILDLEEALALDRDPTVMSNLGQILVRDEQTRRGMRYLEEAASLDPENESAWLGLGVAALNAGLLERARSSFDTALKLEPYHPQALYARAVTLRRLGQTQEAIADLRLLIDKHPEHPEAARARKLLARIRGT